MEEKIMMFCDESCYVKNDGNDCMAISTVYTKKGNVKMINKQIRELKGRHGINPNNEIKWTKISPSNVDFYKDLIKYIHVLTERNSLRIRVLTVKGKSNIDTESYGKSYDEWYHAMYYLLLSKVIDSMQMTYTNFHFLIDYKDTNSKKNYEILSRYLNNAYYVNIQASAEDSSLHQLIQVADIFAGASTYKNRKLDTSDAKKEIIKYIEQLFNISYSKSTTLSKRDFNHFIWEGKQNGKNKISDFSK